MTKTKVTKADLKKQEGDRISGRQPRLEEFNVGELVIPTSARCDIKVEQITHGTYQQREDMSQQSVSDLANSIMFQGLLQPITIRKIAPPQVGWGESEIRYEIVAGHRRFEACKLNQMEKVPCQVINAEDEQAFRLSLDENLRRVNLSPLEEANSFKLAMETFGWDRKKVAFAFNRSQDYVQDRLDLLGLAGDLKHRIDQGEAVSKVEAAAPLSQLGIEPKDDLFSHSASIIEEEVGKVLARNTYPIGKAWDTEICRAAGCLGNDQAGDAICLNLDHAVSMRMQAREGDVKKAVEQFLVEKGKKFCITADDGSPLVGDELPLYYDLARLLSWGQTIKDPPGFPAPPGGVRSDTWGSDSGGCASWPFLTRQVGAPTVRKDCLGCPAWKRRAKQGRALLVRWEHSYGPLGDHWEIEPICCSYTCRHGKVKDGEKRGKKAGANSNVVARQAAQPYIQKHIDEMLDRLAKEPARVLALSMLERYRSTESPSKRGYLGDAAAALGIKVPADDGTPNGTVKALASVGVAPLLAMWSWCKVHHMDGIKRGGYGESAYFSPKVFPLTCALMFGEKYGEEVKAGIRTIEAKARAEFRKANEPPKAKKEAKGGRKKKAPAKAEKMAAQEATT